MSGSCKLWRWKPKPKAKWSWSTASLTLWTTPSTALEYSSTVFYRLHIPWTTAKLTPWAVAHICLDVVGHTIWQTAISFIKSIPVVENNRTSWSCLLHDTLQWLSKALSWHIFYSPATNTHSPDTRQRMESIVEILKWELPSSLVVCLSWQLL